MIKSFIKQIADRGLFARSMIKLMGSVEFPIYLVCYDKNWIYTLILQMKAFIYISICIILLIHYIFWELHGLNERNETVFKNMCFNNEHKINSDVNLLNNLFLQRSPFILKGIGRGAYYNCTLWLLTFRFWYHCFPIFNVGQPSH